MGLLESIVIGMIGGFTAIGVMDVIETIRNCMKQKKQITDGIIELKEDIDKFTAECQKIRIQDAYMRGVAGLPISEKFDNDGSAE